MHKFVLVWRNKYFVLIIVLATLKKNLTMSDFSFSQVTEVETRLNMLFTPRLPAKAILKENSA